MKIVAEIGLNHCGSVERAERLVEDLCNTSVDAVSFQIRESNFYDKSHPRKVELPDSFYKETIEVLHKANKLVCIAIADYGKISLLDQMGVDIWKTLSWDLGNDKLIEALGETKKIIYASTGMSSIEDIRAASEKWERLEFIHTQLNDLVESTNLKAIETIRNATGRQVAFGLHCADHDVLFASLAFAPSALFFYVKDETNDEHPDDLHAISIGKVEWRIQRINDLLKCIGAGEKCSMQNDMHPPDDDVCK